MLYSSVGFYTLSQKNKTPNRLFLPISSPNIDQFNPFYIVDRGRWILLLTLASARAAAGIASRSSYCIIIFQALLFHKVVWRRVWGVMVYLMTVLLGIPVRHASNRSLTRTTRHSCRDPETAVNNFWSPGGVRGRPQRVPSAGSCSRLLLLLPPPASVAAGAAVHSNGW